MIAFNATSHLTQHTQFCMCVCVCPSDIMNAFISDENQNTAGYTEITAAQ